MTSSFDDEDYNNLKLLYVYTYIIHLFILMNILIALICRFQKVF